MKAGTERMSDATAQRVCLGNGKRYADWAWAVGRRFAVVGSILFSFSLTCKIKIKLLFLE